MFLSYSSIFHSVEFQHILNENSMVVVKKIGGRINFCFIVHIPWNWIAQLSHTHVLLFGNPVETWLMLVCVNSFLQSCRNCGGNDSTALSTRPGILPYSSFNVLTLTI